MDCILQTHFMTKICTFLLSKCSSDISNFAVTTLRGNIGIKSVKNSPFLSVDCTQHQSFAFCILRFDPENPFFSVNENVSEYQNFGFRLKISMVDNCKKQFILDHQNLSFLVIDSTICVTLCQWYIYEKKKCKLLYGLRACMGR